MNNIEFIVDAQMINVAGKGDLHNMADFPYGMALVTSYLRQEGFNTLMLQYPLWKSDVYLKKILDNPAYLYGFQVGAENYSDINALVQTIKKQNPHGKIVFGGPFVASFYKEILKEDRDLDAVVLGEGEYTAAELLRLVKEGREDWQLIKGIAFLNDQGEVVLNEHRPAIQDLDALPYAARDGIEEEAFDQKGNYMNDVRITTSRGCTSNCTFCAVNINSKLQKAKRWRGRDPIRVVDEIEGLVNTHNIRLINLQDSAFDDPGTLGAKRTRIFCEEIIKRGLEISMKVYYRAHPIKDDPESIELYKLYKEAGVDVIIIGVEAGSNYELELYGKSATVEDNYRSFRVMQDLDLFFTHIGIIMFGPYTTFDTLKANYRFVHKYRMFYWYHNIDSVLILTPGAGIFDMMRKEGRLIPKKNFWEYPDYQFENSSILKLAEHYQKLRTFFPHLDVGNPLVLNASNIISRLKNKLNREVAKECSQDIEAFTNIFEKNRSVLNELGFQGTMENIERLEKDGLGADLVKASEPYFGKNWGVAIDEIQKGYENLVEAIQTMEFGLAGIVFKAELTKRERQTENLKTMKFREI